MLDPDGPQPFLVGDKKKRMLMDAENRHNQQGAANYYLFPQLARECHLPPQVRLGDPVHTMEAVLATNLNYLSSARKRDHSG